MASAAVHGLRLVAPLGHRQASPRLHVVERQLLGRRVVGVTTVLGLVALAVLLGLAVFHSALAEGQYQLSQVESDIEFERQSALELEYELEALSAPGHVELIAQGVLGLVSAAEPIDLPVNPAHIAATARVDDDVLNGSGTDWLALKQLLNAS